MVNCPRFHKYFFPRLHRPSLTTADFTSLICLLVRGVEEGIHESERATVAQAPHIAAGHFDYENITATLRIHKLGWTSYIVYTVFHGSSHCKGVRPGLASRPFNLQLRVFNGGSSPESTHTSFIKKFCPLVSSLLCITRAQSERGEC